MGAWWAPRTSNPLRRAERFAGWVQFPHTLARMDGQASRLPVCVVALTPEIAYEKREKHGKIMRVCSAPLPGEGCPRMTRMIQRMPRSTAPEIAYEKRGKEQRLPTNDTKGETQHRSRMVMPALSYLAKYLTPGMFSKSLSCVQTVASYLFAVARIILSAIGILFFRLKTAADIAISAFKSIT